MRLSLGLAFLAGALVSLGEEASGQDARASYEPIIRAYHAERHPRPDETTYNVIRPVGERRTRRGEVAELVCVNYTMTLRFFGARETILAAMWVKDGRVIEVQEGVPGLTACAVQQEGE